MFVSIIGKGKMGESVAKYLANNLVPYRVYDSKSLVSVQSLIDDSSSFVIDCSVGEAFLNNLDKYIEAKQKIIVVATGWYSEMETIKQKINNSNSSLLWADNFSIGIWIYKQILATACQLSTKYANYDVFGLEHHHRIKKDSPAGTTRKIADLILENYPSKSNVSFDNPCTQIPSDTLHIACLRGGENNIIHKFYFDNANDVIEIGHNAKTREGFTDGIIKSIDYLDKAPNGFYDFEDMMK
jgi:4-hydroxy-tetrahydrodipicolinate reductase